jgi:hypothetical protein
MIAVKKKMIVLGKIDQVCYRVWQECVSCHELKASPAVGERAKPTGQIQTARLERKKAQSENWASEAVIDIEPTTYSNG